MATEQLRFHEGDRIELGYVSDLYELLRAIDVAMPKQATLYVEGTSIEADIKEFLASRQTSERQEVEPGTLWPKPETFHLSLEGRNLEELRSMANQHAGPEVCDHLVVYLDDEVLLWAHDAGSGYVWIARSLPAETVNRFRSALGPAIRASP